MLISRLSTLRVGEQAKWLKGVQHCNLGFQIDALVLFNLQVSGNTSSLLPVELPALYLELQTQLP